MIYFDAIMVAILAFATWRGAVKGVAWQLAAIGAMVLCFLFATPVSAAIAPMIKVDPPLNRWLAMLATYLVFSFGCFAVARVFRAALEAIRFQEYDSHLGAVFGFIKGLVICFSITFFAVCLTTGKLQEEILLKTNAGYVSSIIMARLVRVLPPEIDRVINRYTEPLEQAGNRILEKEFNDPPLNIRDEIDPSEPAQRDSSNGDDDFGTDLPDREQDRRGANGRDRDEEPGGRFEDRDPPVQPRGGVNGRPGADRNNPRIGDFEDGDRRNVNTNRNTQPRSNDSRHSNDNDEPIIAGWLRQGAGLLRSDVGQQAVETTQNGVAAFSDLVSGLFQSDANSRRETPRVQPRDSAARRNSNDRGDRTGRNLDEPDLMDVDDLDDDRVSDLRDDRMGVRRDDPRDGRRNGRSAGDLEDGDVAGNDEVVGRDSHSPENRPNERPAMRFEKPAVGRSRNAWKPSVETNTHRSVREPGRSIGFVPPASSDDSWRPRVTPLQRTSNFDPVVPDGDMPDIQPGHSFRQTRIAGPGHGNDAVIDRREVIERIANIYASHGERLDAERTAIESLVAEMPPEVVDDVLDDWLSDLSGAALDPAPETAARLPFDDRVRWHLRRNGGETGKSPQALRGNGGRPGQR